MRYLGLLLLLCGFALSCTNNTTPVSPYTINLNGLWVVTSVKNINSSVVVNADYDGYIKTDPMTVMGAETTSDLPFKIYMFFQTTPLNSVTTTVYEQKNGAKVSTTQPLQFNITDTALVTVNPVTGGNSTIWLMTKLNLNYLTLSSPTVELSLVKAPATSFGTETAPASWNTVISPVDNTAPTTFSRNVNVVGTVGLINDDKIVCTEDPTKGLQISVANQFTMTVKNWSSIIYVNVQTLQNNTDPTAILPTYTESVDGKTLKVSGGTCLINAGITQNILSLAYTCSNSIATDGTDADTLKMNVTGYVSCHLNRKP